MAIKGGDPILEKQNWSTWFFGLCAFMFFCYGCVVYQEFVSRRTYVVYQTRARDFDYAKTSKEFAAYQKTFDASKEKPLQDALAQAEAAEKSPEYRKLEDSRYPQFRQFVYMRTERSKVKSNEDAKFYDWKHAEHTRGEKDSFTKQQEKEYWELDIQLHGFHSYPKSEGGCVQDVTASAAPDEYKNEPQFQSKDWLSWDEKVRNEQVKLCDIDSKIGEYKDKVKAAQDALDAYKKGYQSYVDALDRIKTRSVRTVDQIVNDKLGIGGAYTFGTVDRCRSCHVNVDKLGYDLTAAPGAKADAFAFDKIPDTGDPLSPYKKYANVFSTHSHYDLLMKTHPVEQYGCTVCHGGQGRATRIKTEYPWQDPDKFVYAVDMDQPHGPATEHGAHQWEDPIHRGDYVQANCQKCHAPERWLDDAPVYEKGKDLFIQKGCHGCHVIKGYEDLPRIGPELLKIKSKVKPEWIISWIYNPRDFYENTRMPMFVFDDVQVGAPNPRDNVKVMAHKDLQRDTAMKIAAYLWQNSAPEDALPAGKFPGGGNPANGLKVIETVGCLGCHVLKDDAAGGDVGTGRAPPLDKAGAKMASEDWIWNWIHEPRWHSATTRMPNLRLSEDEAKDITAWLWQAGKDAPVAADPELAKALPDLVKGLDDPKNAEAGDTLIAQWGCAGCHLIKGHEHDGRIAPELTLFGEKKPYELAFGDTKVKEDWLDWTLGKLDNPRQYVDVRAAARMPWFGLSDDDRHALSVYLMGMRDPRVPESMKKQFTGAAAQIERGRALVNDFNCVGCHTIEGRGGLILAYSNKLAEKNGWIPRQLQPPNLKSEGLKIQASFLLDFLKNPGGPNGAQGPRIRPWVKIRMPTFPLTDEDRADIIAYFRAVEGIEDPYDVVSFNNATPGTQTASAANPMGLDPAKVARGEKLFMNPASEGGFNCRACHVWHGERSAGATDENVAPDLANVWFRFRPDGVRVWLEAPQKAMPGTKMPGFFFDWDPKKDSSPTGPASKESLDPVLSTPDGKPFTYDQTEDEIDAIRQFLFSQGTGHGSQVSMNP